MASVSISCPSCSATDGGVRNGKSTAGHQRYLCSHCRKTWQLQFTYTASQPGTHQKILARLGRKSLSFSKSVELHDKVIGHYLNIKHYQ
ncbi:IS1 family transposase [Escherichia coli]|uniref:IS1 family transposase n=1 Tax=Escherichia coli TaxID=562 RepID=UPI0029C2EBD0|nr:IS1 family transposase [Escherichia coli]MDX5533724.1 IS1 family transposase [Escherichia coli]